MYLPAARGFDTYLGIPYSDDMGLAKRTPCHGKTTELPMLEPDDYGAQPGRPDKPHPCTTWPCLGPCSSAPRPLGVALTTGARHCPAVYTEADEVHGNDIQNLHDLNKGMASRRRDCHFADASLSIAIEKPTEGRGGCSRMTASPTASSAPNPSWRQISRSLYATRAERGK